MSGVKNVDTVVIQWNCIVTIDRKLINYKNIFIRNLVWDMNSIYIFKYKRHCLDGIISTL